MDVYKVRVEDFASTPITVENFERDTLKRPPFYTVGSSGAPSHFAVCPGCDNPILLVGLYKKLAHTPYPYGRHHGSSISGLAEYIQSSYDSCIYANPDRQPDPSARRAQADGLPQKILNLLVENFDTVIYVIEQSVGIKVSDALARRMLEGYRDEQGHLYKAATLLNIPWVFAYMSKAKSLARQRIINNQPLIDNIRKGLSNVRIEDEGKLKGVIQPSESKIYLDISVSFIHHRIFRVDQKISESMKMVVFTKSGKHAISLHEQAILFNPDYFIALINRPPERSYRPRKDSLVALAKEVLL